MAGPSAGGAALAQRWAPQERPCGRTGPRRYGGPGEGTGTTGGTTHHGKPFFQRCLAANQGTAPAEQRVWRGGVFAQIQAMTQLQGGMGIHSLCGLARVSRASYYRHWVQTAPREAEGELRDRNKTAKKKRRCPKAPPSLGGKRHTAR